MSSCLATTLRSSDTPPSGLGVAPVVGGVVCVTAGVGVSAAGVGVSCAVAAPAVRSAAANDSIVDTHRVPARIGFVIEFLARWRATAMPRRSVRWMKPTLSARRGPGTKEDVRRKRRPNSLVRRKPQRFRPGPGRRYEIDRGGAVMTECKTDRTIVVGEDRRRVAVVRAGREDGRRASRGKRWRVVVPTEEERLEEDRKSAKQRDPAARSRQPRSIGPNPRGRARMHVRPLVSAVSPLVSAVSRRSQ
jgi:hypothetical protein